MRRSLIVPVALALPLIVLATQATSERGLLKEAKTKPSSSDVTMKVGPGGLDISIAPGKDGYPGVAFAPPAGAWDLSKFGHVEARLVNTGTSPLTVALRVDNAGNWQDNPWNTEGITLQPGEHGTLKTLFGYQYGYKKGFALDPSRVVNVLLFASNLALPQSFRVESLVAAGPAHEAPPVAPEDVRTKPSGGVLFDKSLPTGSPDLTYENGATFVEQGPRPRRLILSFPKGASDAIGRIKPPTGRWDLRNATEVRLTLRNVGTTSAMPRARVESNGGTTAWHTCAKPLAPDAEIELAVPFGRRIDLNTTAPSDLATSDAVSSIAFSAAPSSADVKLELVRAVAVAPVAETPSWLGARPPVPGAWTKTLSEEFNGSRPDPTVWKTTGENYFDKASHWSKSAVIVQDGLARLRYERKTGFQNDDPKRNATPYAAGYLDTYGLWAQRYGYFEARMRLPKAPGLWPAFWMMPDRGSKGGPEQWKRQSTADGGMEFDIMEHLTRWGGHRYNIAMHYDGYEKDHKQLGSDKVYVEADKDGFITCGLLWTPGEAVYYCNGQEVLRWKSPRVSNVPSILMFTLPSGGWDNDALDGGKLPSDLAIDYVRVWQRKDLASSTDGRRNEP